MILLLVVLDSVNVMHLSASGRVDPDQKGVLLPGWHLLRQFGVGHLSLPLEAAFLTITYIALTSF